MRKDRRKHLLEMVSKDLDIRDRWMGIRALKKGYQPIPYRLKNTHGRRVTVGNKAEEAAKFLEQKIWGATGYDSPISTQRGPIYQTPLNIREGPISMSELKDVIKDLKRHKAAGPDKIPAEFFKEMDQDSRRHVLGILNVWWDRGDMPETTLQARVVLIYKKGDKEDLGNYRPI